MAPKYWRYTDKDLVKNVVIGDTYTVKNQLGGDNTRFNITFPKEDGQDRAFNVSYFGPPIRFGEPYIKGDQKKTVILTQELLDLLQTTPQDEISSEIKEKYGFKGFLKLGMCGQIDPEDTEFKDKYKNFIKFNNNVSKLIREKAIKNKFVKKYGKYEVDSDTIKEMIPGPLIYDDEDKKYKLFIDLCTPMKGKPGTGTAFKDANGGTVAWSRLVGHRSVISIRIYYSYGYINKDETRVSQKILTGDIFEMIKKEASYIENPEMTEFREKKRGVATKTNDNEDVVYESGPEDVENPVEPKFDDSD